MGTPAHTDVTDLLALARVEAKRVERSARIVKQLVARAEAAAAANPQSQEDTEHGNDEAGMEEE